MDRTGAARDAAVKIVQVLHDHGHTAYLNGGCVRDTLLGIEPKDYDVATDARPDVVRRLFDNTQYVGESFGVVLVRLNHVSIEVATFRIEWGYQDGRRPTQVQFSDAEHDALRRDFTINALFEDPLATSEADRIIDYVDGRADLEAGLIRAVGDPDQRFGEDYLRMLRAVRFAAWLGFKIEKRTARAIRNHAHQLGRISPERIGQEVAAMLTPAPPARPATAIRLMQRLRLDSAVLNEDHAAVKIPTTAALRAKRGNPISYATVLAAWMLDRHVFHDEKADTAAVERFVEGPMPAVVRRWRRSLCLSNDDRDALRAILTHLPRALAWSSQGVALRKRLLATPCWPQVFALLCAERHRPGVTALAGRIDREAKALFAEGVAPPPLANGDDLIAMGHKPGPEFRRLLDAVYDAQLEGRIRSRQDALRWLQQAK
ncbi:MAG: CCA tRNA nucleotidyltransferase [Phycisphaeraceae bacterium]